MKLGLGFVGFLVFSYFLILFEYTEFNIFGFRTIDWSKCEYVNLSDEEFLQTFFTISHILSNFKD